MESTSVVASLITAAIAIIGITVTATLGFLQRRDSIKGSERTSLSEAARQLGSRDTSRRAAGVVAASQFTKGSRITGSARMLLLSALHFEDSAFVTHQGLETLRDDDVRPQAIDDLIRVNRVLWRSFRSTAFRVFANAELLEGSTELYEQAALLARNRELLSALLAGRRWSSLNASDTFLPDFSVPGASFARCDFRKSVLPYANLRGVSFTDCLLDRCVLIGAYLEETTLLGRSSRTGAVLARTDRQPGTAATGDGDVLQLIDRELTSFAIQFEHDWRGYWESTAADRSSYSATWWVDAGSGPGGSTSDRTAELLLEDATFIRTRSSDANDGWYTIDRRLVLDRTRSLSVVGGSRTLRRQVTAPWFAVWWERFTPQP
jgi:uncharacterized protein YjbI with pentapeptide repeats